LTKVPSLNYPDVTRAFERAGWELIRQKGSHMIFAHGRRKIVIPAHKPIKRSTLARILKQAGISIDEFLDLLR
jgi:predicted RNA binding protein YcfA (HicA-like mRNA interferase family)